MVFGCISNYIIYDIIWNTEMQTLKDGLYMHGVIVYGHPNEFKHIANIISKNISPHDT